MGTRIALFGGAFNPPHLGHVLATCYAWKTAALDAIWVLPSAHHPWGKEMVPWEFRWRLCQLAFADLPFVAVRDDERRNQSGRTVDLVETLQDEHPGVRFALIGGSDTRDQLPSWYRGEELARLVDVVAVPRGGYDDHPAALPGISSTAIRERLAAGQPIDELVPATVAAAIASEGWYRAEDP
jgi:nicotinate-nucleotide adenylyltransferase